VDKRGFKEWLKREGYELIDYKKKPFKSNNLESKINKMPIIAYVKYGKGQISTRNIIVVTSDKELSSRGTHYILDIAGLHQPHKGSNSVDTYMMINKLLKKYAIYEVDLAIDYVRSSPMSDEVIYKAFGDAINITPSFSSRYINLKGRKDICIYDKGKKSGLYNGIWYRLEIAFRFPKLSKLHKNSIAIERGVRKQSVIDRNRVYLELISKEADKAVLKEVVECLSSKPYTTSRLYLDMQIAKYLNTRKPLPIYS